MSDNEGAEGSQDPEAPEEELDDEHQVLLHFSKHGEARRSLPWEQWTFREKANYYMDRIFLGFLITFLLLLMGECGYKFWYVSKVNQVGDFLYESVVFLFDWLLTQDRREELAEL